MVGTPKIYIFFILRGGGSNKIDENSWIKYGVGERKFQDGFIKYTCSQQMRDRNS